MNQFNGCAQETMLKMRLHQKGSSKSHLPWTLEYDNLTLFVIYKNIYILDSCNDDIIKVLKSDFDLEIKSWENSNQGNIT